MKIYGPYLRKDGRMHIIKYDGINRITQSYPRYMMEKLLDRELLPEEEVDHKDDDCTNNSIYNFQVITGTRNRQKEMGRPFRAQKYSTHTCPECGVEFTKKLNQIKGNLVKGRAGPFCTRSCAGKHNARNQYSLKVT